MVPATTEVSAIIAVDHSKVLTRRRRSAMKLGRLSEWGAGKYPGRGGPPVQAENPPLTLPACSRPLTACSSTSSVRSDGDGVPRNRLSQRSMCQADDSYRDVLAVGVRSEAAGGRLFCCPGTAKERATSDGFPDRVSGWRHWRGTAARRQSHLGPAPGHRLSVSHDVRER